MNSQSPQDKIPSNLKVHLLLVLTTFFWGGSFLFNKIGLMEIPPTHFVFIRFSLASLIMLALCATRLRFMTRDIIRRGAIVGVALGMTNLTFVFGVSGTSISRAGILNNMFVLFIPLICALLWRDRVGRANMAGIVLAVAGIALLASGGSGFNRGDLISTVCAGFIAVHIISVSKVLRNDDVYLVSLVQFVTVTFMSGVLRTGGRCASLYNRHCRSGIPGVLRGFPDSPLFYDSEQIPALHHADQGWAGLYSGPCLESDGRVHCSRGAVGDTGVERMRPYLHGRSRSFAMPACP